ncbi:MAG: hypothetical protein HYY18_12485 [Planctomycetes bacterium]|nr:hypothetical protein [Planctomycetota bacterium]
MNWIVFLILAITATAAQLTLAPMFGVGRAAPDLAIVLFAAIALRTGTPSSCFAAWSLGLARDLCGGSGPGPFALMFLFSALLTGALRGVLFPSRPLGMGLGAFIAAWMVHAPYGVVMAFRYGTGLGWALAHAFAIAALTGIVGAMAARPFARIRGVAGWAPDRELLA